VRNALVQQPCQFAVRAALVFGFGARFVQYRPHALTGMVAQQHRQQLVAVQAIGLGASGPPVHLDARGVDHDVVDALLDKPAVQPLLQVLDALAWHGTGCGFKVSASGAHDVQVSVSCGGLYCRFEVRAAPVEKVEGQLGRPATRARFEFWLDRQRNPGRGRGADAPALVFGNDDKLVIPRMTTLLLAR
jgi:hypothetical protein